MNFRRKNSVFLHGNWKINSISESGKIEIGVMTDPMEGWHPVELHEPGLDIITAYALLKEVIKEDIKVTILAAYVVSKNDSVRILADVESIEFHVQEKYKSEIAKIRRQLRNGKFQIKVLGKEVYLSKVIAEVNFLDN